MNEKEKEIYDKTCKLIQEKLREITTPVCNGGSHSYEQLTDVITNVILLEMNLTRTPLDQIPKREVKFETQDNLRKEVLSKISEEELAELLCEKLYSYEMRSDYLTEEKAKRWSLFLALKLYIGNFKKDEY